MIERVESTSENNSNLAVSEEPCCFCLCGRSNNISDAFAFSVNWTIHWWCNLRRVGDTVAQIKMARKTTSSVRENKIGGVGVDIQDHVTFVETNFGVWIGADEIQKPLDFLPSKFSWVGLGHGNFI